MSIDKKVEEYLNYLYGDEKDDPIYAPDIYQSRKDFKAGYETAKSKWIRVEDKLPENDRTVVVYVNNTENPQWSGLKLGAYLNEKWYCNEGRKSHEIVVRWVEIPQ